MVHTHGKSRLCTKGSTLSHLQFSIDLDAELNKITRDQHLNDVHYLVQLVRHAMRHNPSRIQLDMQRNHLEFSHDGASLSMSESNCLWDLLNPESPKETRQAALHTLEKRHGIILLSLLRNSEEVSLRYIDHVLEGKQGRVSLYSEASEERGYRLILRGNRVNKTKEINELKYFCSGCKTPVVVNGKPINAPIVFQGQILIQAFDESGGDGYVGIPISGDVCTTDFYKAGIRVGTKTFMPRNGLLYHGYWNNQDVLFEDTYLESTKKGDATMEKWAIYLYAKIPEFFDGVSNETKARLKKLLMGLDHDIWDTKLESLKLFASPSSAWQLSMDDIEDLDQRFFYVPYTTQGRRTSLTNIPVLEGDEVAFLSNVGYELKLVQAQPSKPKQSWRQRGRLRDETSLVQNEKDFLNRLNYWDTSNEYAFSEGPLFINKGTDGRQVICLPYSHPLVIHALKNGFKNTVEMVRFKYLILAELEGQGYESVSTYDECGERQDP